MKAATLKPGIISVILLYIISSALLLIPATRVEAVSASDWQAGNIISDAKFTDTSISTAEIQSQLESIVPTCDTNGVQNSEYYAPPSADTNGNGIISRAEYGAYKGNPAPFTCLDDYYENPDTKANNYGSSTIPSGAKSAAQLIVDAGKSHNISPRALLVMLRKESSVVADDWPFLSQYQYAMGARCPDGPNGANCDPDYAGFGVQIDEAARLLRYYIDNMDQSWWPHKKPGTNYLLWNTIYSYYTNSSGQSVQCGGSNVNIQNYATAALYTYTPYQPNAASVAAFPAAASGSSFDSNCGSYGNRNFWYFYNSMFGNSRGKNGQPINIDYPIHTKIDFDTSSVSKTNLVALAKDNSTYDRTPDSVGGSDWGTSQQLADCAYSSDLVRQQDGRLLHIYANCNRSIEALAQDDVANNTWSSTATFIGGYVNDIVTMRQNDGRVRVFAVGDDQSIWSKVQTTINSTNWGTWQKIGGKVLDLRVEKEADGRITIAAIGLNRGLWTKTQTASNADTWSTWSNQGGFVNQIATSFHSDGRIIIGGIGGNGELFTKSQSSANATQYDSWVQHAHPSVYIERIEATRENSGRVSFAAIGQDKRTWLLQQASANSSDWRDWVDLGGQASDIGIVRSSGAELSVVVIGGNEKLWTRTQQGASSTTWGSWTLLAGDELYPY